ncbi:hypothetical protein A6R68_01217 [Neotoma lepida]|uniref:Uncharacterized protein n=1 Tax=Neotoma lepida TaxID=56216 RepID=A0A1A6GV75_NEOLE|nr:hypothetical protein A6R68_01217 [Neotoma lepida]
MFKRRGNKMTKGTLPFESITIWHEHIVLRCGSRAYHLQKLTWSKLQHIQKAFKCKAVDRPEEDLFPDKGVLSSAHVMSTYAFSILASGVTQNSVEVPLIPWYKAQPGWCRRCEDTVSIPEKVWMRQSSYNVGFNLIPSTSLTPPIAGLSLDLITGSSFGDVYSPDKGSPSSLLEAGFISSHL